MRLYCLKKQNKSWKQYFWLCVNNLYCLLLFEIFVNDFPSNRTCGGSSNATRGYYHGVLQCFSPSYWFDKKWPSQSTSLRKFIHYSHPFQPADSFVNQSTNDRNSRTLGTRHQRHSSLTRATCQIITIRHERPSLVELVIIATVVLLGLHVK